MRALKRVHMGLEGQFSMGFLMFSLSIHVFFEVLAVKPRILRAAAHEFPPQGLMGYILKGAPHLRTGSESSFQLVCRTLGLAYCHGTVTDEAFFISYYKLILIYIFFLYKFAYLY